MFLIPTLLFKGIIKADAAIKMKWEAHPAGQTSRFLTTYLNELNSEYAKCQHPHTFRISRSFSSRESVSLGCMAEAALV